MIQIIQGQPLGSKCKGLIVIGMTGMIMILISKLNKYRKPSEVIEQRDIEDKQNEHCDRSTGPKETWILA